MDAYVGSLMDSTWASATSSKLGPRYRPRRFLPRAACAVCLWLAAAATQADEVYLEPAAFVSEAFDGKAPAAQKLWVTPALNAKVKDILGNALGLRQKYWREGQRTVWILEAIGRDKPITAGYVVEHAAITRAAILIYRESRGAEVRHPFFTDQFKGATLKADSALDRHIDGITGATLSVHAISALARVALLLDEAARAEPQ
jgi:hypothetical protein